MRVQARVVIADNEEVVGGGGGGAGRAALQQYGDSAARRKLQAQCWAAVVNACTDAVSDIPTAGSSAAAASDTDAALSAGASAGMDVRAGTAGTETEKTSTKAIFQN